MVLVWLSAQVPVSGILDARGNQAFVRAAGYRRSQHDTYVPATQLRRYGLRTGDHVEGTARQHTGVTTGAHASPSRRTGTAS